MKMLRGMIMLVIALMLLSSVAIADTIAISDVHNTTLIADNTAIPAVTTPGTDSVVTPVTTSPKINISGFATKTLAKGSPIQISPGLLYPAIGALNNSIILNAGIIAPVASTGSTGNGTATTSANIKVGPVFTVVLNKLVAQTTKLQWLAPEGVELGAGLMGDIYGMSKSGSSIKDNIMYTLSLKIWTL